MSGLVENFIRRIEKLLDVRATIPTQGTNHVDNTWLSSDIYPGELAIDLTTGSLYTSDGTAVIDLNRENFILSGLQVSKDTSGVNKLTVQSGSARINGITYVFDSSGTDIFLPPNILLDPKLYFIYGIPSNSVYGDGNYTLDFTTSEVFGSTDINGIFYDISSSENIPTAPSDSLLLGMVLLYPGATGFDLWPISVAHLGDYYPKFSITPSELLRKTQATTALYEYHHLYLPGQFIIDYASDTIYLSKRLFVSSYSSIASDITAGNLDILAGGGGTGSGGSYTALSVGTGAEVYKTTVSTQFQFRSLTASYPVTLTQNANDISIGLSMSAFVGSINNVGTGATVYSSITGGGIAQLRSLTAGSTRLTISTVGNNIVLDVPFIGTTAQGRNLGSAFDADIYAGMTGINLGFRRLKMGVGMTATQYSDYIELATTVRNNNGLNLVGGAPIYFGMAGDNLAFRSLTAGSNITITNIGNQIRISSSSGGGSVTGATNLGASAGELYVGPVGSDLGFRSITPGFGIAVTRVGNNVQIDTTVVDGTQGIQGPQGPQGTQGFQGLRGFQGFQGLSGTNGTNGLQGRQGPFGPQGFEGPPGPTGINGLNAPLGAQRIIELYDSVGGATVSSTAFRILNLDTTRLNTDAVLYQTGAVSQIPPDGTYVQIAESGNYKFDFNVTLQIPANGFAIAYIWNNSTSAKVTGSDIWFNARSTNTETITSSSSVTLNVSGGSQYSIRLESITGPATTQQFASSLSISKLEIGMGLPGATGAGFQGPQGFQGPIGEPLTELIITGTQDNANKVFTLSSALTVGTQHMFFINGQLLVNTEDYTISGTTLTLDVSRPAPSVYDSLRIFGSVGAVITGVAGPQGNRGFQGPQGNQGTLGATGTDGVAGPQGNRGFQGPQGNQGTLGATGTDGVAGPQGFQGSIGIGYELSASNSVSVGTGTKSFSVDKTSSRSAFSNGNRVRISYTFIIWMEGIISSYVGTDLIVVVDSTSVLGGTYNEWAIDLAGEKGVQGPQGFRGFQGSQGLQGPQGNQGFQGPQGNQGPLGATANINDLNISNIGATTYSISSSDSTLILQFTANSPVTVTIPAGLTPSKRFEGKQLGTGQISFVGATGVTLNRAATENAKTAEQYSVFAIDWTDTETYMIYGKLELV